MGWVRLGFDGVVAGVDKNLYFLLSTVGTQAPIFTLLSLF